MVASTVNDGLLLASAILAARLCWPQPSGGGFRFGVCPPLGPSLPLAPAPQPFLDFPILQPSSFVLPTTRQTGEAPPLALAIPQSALGRLAHGSLMRDGPRATVVTRRPVAQNTQFARRVLHQTSVARLWLTPRPREAVIHPLCYHRYSHSQPASGCGLLRNQDGHMRREAE